MTDLTPRRILVQLFLAVVAVPTFALAQSGRLAGDIQIIRGPRESVAVFRGVVPVDESGSLVGAGDPALQLKQALENLRRLAAGVGISPGHFVTLTLHVKENSGGEWEKIARESFADWNPATTLVEAKDLRVAGAMVEVEGVALVRARPGR